MEPAQLASMSSIWVCFIIFAALGVYFFFLALLNKGFFRGRYKRKKRELIDSGNHKFIENFVKRYKDSNFVKEVNRVKVQMGIILRKIGPMEYQRILDPIVEEVHKLRGLIAKQGILFSEREIIWLIQEETARQNYEDFKMKMFYGEPKTKDEYISTLIEVYGDGYLQHMSDFKKLLTEMKLYFNEYELGNQIEHLKKEKELKYFEEKLAIDQSFSISIHDLDLFSGYEFEQFLKTLFEKMGYTVEHTKLSGDQGADLIVHKHGEKTAIQAKRRSGKVNNKAIQEVVAAIKHYGADRGMVITTGEFTRSAVQLAGSNNVDLMSRAELEKLVAKFF
jgi:HJR/Mrr/RecB family endonuclease